MDLLERTVTLLDDWSLSRNPDPADSRHIIGSWAAKSMLQYVAVEYLVHLTWEDYDYSTNVVSDLGARGCQDIAGHLPCRTSFVVVDLSFMFIGLGAIVAAFLITSAVLRVGGHYTHALAEMRLSKLQGTQCVQGYARLCRHLGGEHFGRPLDKSHRLTLATRIALGATGLAMVGVGSMPEDYIPLGHYLSTAIFLIGAVATLALLGKLWWLPQRKVAVFLLSLALLALIGGLGFGYMFLRQWLGTDIAGWPVGLFERFVVYAFIAGTVTMGLTLSSGAHRRP